MRLERGTLFYGETGFGIFWFLDFLLCLVGMHGSRKIHRYIKRGLQLEAIIMIDWIEVLHQKPEHDIDLIVKDQGGVVYSARYREVRDEESYFFIRVGAETFIPEWETDIFGVIEYYSYLQEA